MPHDAYLTTLAPADEYFGQMGMSILGIENELKHINYMLDYNYGNRESGPAIYVAQSIVDDAKGLSARPRHADADVLVLYDAAAHDSDDSRGRRPPSQGDSHRGVPGQPASAQDCSAARA